MMKSKVTSLDVARRAGVSQSAVSRAFNKNSSISQALQAKVELAARELGYRPNHFARAMITGRSHLIGLVVAHLDNPFYSEAIQRFSRALQTQGFQIIVFIGLSTIDDLDRVMGEILHYQVDGVILASVSRTSILAQRCADEGIPVLLFNRDQEGQDLPAITTDNYGGGREIAAHLAGIACDRIGFVAGYEGAYTHQERERGFRDGLAEAGLALTAREVGNFEYAGARIAALEMFAGQDRPDAVFVCNDHMAFAVMDVLRSKLGLRIPEDVCVAGFDDVPIAAWPAYDLTSYRQPIGRMIDRTVTEMVQRIETPSDAADKITLKGELILRGSTRRDNVGSEKA